MRSGSSIGQTGASGGAIRVVYGSLTDQSANQGEPVSEAVGIAGSGAIACGLAAVAAQRGHVVVWARSDDSARRAQDKVSKLCEKAGVNLNGNVRVAVDAAALAEATFVVEAIAEDPEAKSALLRDLAAHVGEQAIIASTTSSLSIEALAGASGRPERFVGLHVFNPVPKMDLIELVFPQAASEETRRRARALCEALGKTAVEVPDTPGFVVNRLLFPFLFEAVRLMESTGLEAQAVDTCMQLGAGHPMGPLALLDLVGLDVSASIGRTIGAEVPPVIDRMIADGALGRKARRGFYDYD
jgi:3-hydroxybutyryl-CoA dehydrogenase